MNTLVIALQAGTTEELVPRIYLFPEDISKQFELHSINGLAINSGIEHQFTQTQRDFVTKLYDGEFDHYRQPHYISQPLTITGGVNIASVDFL